MNLLHSELEALCGTIKHAPEAVDLEQVRALARRTQYFLEGVQVLRHPVFFAYNRELGELELRFTDLSADDEDGRLGELIRYLYELDDEEVVR